jgi:NAD(P)-dependent dehydrogenase (short-subunit alcohol dehydrogenase family)
MTTVYFISGGSRGIGFAFVKQLSSRPDTTILATATDPDSAGPLNEWAKEHSNVKIIKYDARVEEDAELAAQQAEKLVTKIDVFIGNAAISKSFYRVANTPKQVWKDHWTINVLGPVFLFQALYPLLGKGTRRQIIFISSVAGSIGNYIGHSLSAYGQSKAALNYTAKELSHELAGEGFVVVALNPGFVTSDMGRHGSEQIAKIDPELAKQAAKYHITPEESARKQLQLLDGLSQEDNGKFLNYEGGVELAW